MTLHPENIDELREQLSQAKSIGDFNLSAIDRLIEHVPEDMTATVQAGMTLEKFQAQLAKQSQWLPVDPPCPDVLSIGALLAGNASGPRRFGCGTIRDWLIGITVVLADGRLIRNGGKVVKNVAGFDLCKLFVGSRGSLGVIVEATFKLLPSPEREIFLKRECESYDVAGEFIKTIWESDLRPTVLDLFQFENEPLRLVLGLSGAAADVNAQQGLAAALGINATTNLDYDAVLRVDHQQMTSVPPADLNEFLKRENPVSFVARAGNGVVYLRGPRGGHEPSALEQRIKDTFDPKGVLPKL
jgi:FAD/FMN-containing dehydrogenase